MTTVQLAMHLCNRLTAREWSKLPLDVAEEVRLAAQAGINEFASLLPAHRQRRPESGTLRAPMSQAISIVQGSREFAYVAGGGAYPAGGYSAEADALGHSVTVAGDSNLNLLLEPGKLRQAYLGTSGTQSMTVYGDAVQLGASAVLVHDRPRLNLSTGRVFLDPFSSLWERPHQIEVGDPRWWWMEPIGGADNGGTVPMFALRVWPAPAAVCSITFELSSFPSAITFLDLHQEARTLPVTGQEEPYIVNLCLEHLLPCPLWREDVDKTLVRTLANAARTALASRDRPMSGAPNRILTPPGF